MCPKIFCIGLHKTGTSTLKRCLEILRYNVCPEEESYLTSDLVGEGKYRTCLRLAMQYDAFEDSPWNYRNFYRVLDAVFPSAKFILTVRDSESWYKSILRWVSLHNISENPNIVNALGCPVYLDNKEEVITTYQQRIQEAQSYFNDQEGKLLTVNWEAGEGWDQLCPFLDKPVLDIEFPHVLRYDENTLFYIPGVL